MDYIDPHIPYKPVEQPKHVYTIEFRRALFSEELFELYERYEKAVHKKDRDRRQLRQFVCSSPVYDANDPKEKYRVDRHACLTFEDVDEGRVADELGPNPGLGTIHF